MNAEVIAKSSGETTQVESSTIDLEAPSIVRLSVERSQVAGFERNGDDLTVRLNSGETMHLDDFYVQHDGAGSDLVLRERDGTLWRVAAPGASGSARFSLVNDIDELLAEDDDSSSLALPLLGLGGGGAAIAAAAGGGGSGSDVVRENEPEPNPPTSETDEDADPDADSDTDTDTDADADSDPDADTETPRAPTATVGVGGVSVTGTGEPGATVQVRDATGVIIGSGTVGANGDYSVALADPQTNGETVTVTQRDPAGNVSPSVTAIAPDITAPDAPQVSIAADGRTASGSGEAGATITITGGHGQIVGTATVGADGRFSAPLTPPQANGETLVATQRDAAGNVSEPITIAAPDGTAPAAPAATLDATGTVVTGTGEPGATVEVRNSAGTVLGTGAAGTNGAFAVTLTTPQIDSQSLTVTQADASGNRSPATTLTAPDLTAPAAPAGTVAADGASISGTGEPGATVTITSPVGAPIGTATVDAQGAFTAPLTPPQTNGQVLGLTQSDAAGNVSPPASATAPDVVPNDSPDAPTATVSADGVSVSGVGQAGATVTVFGTNGVSLGTAIAGAGGAYTVTLQTPQVNGETLRVVQADAEGDLSPPTAAVAPDLTPPSAPVATIDGTGAIVTGTGEAGATVRVADPSGTILGTAQVNADGAFTVTLTPPQANGQALQVTQADPAGNASPAAALTAPDLTAPSAPTASLAPDGTAVSGTGEPGATVTVRDANGTSIGTGTVGGNGSYTVPLAPTQTNGQSLTVSQADPVGNRSPVVEITAPDTQAPAAPTGTVTGDGATVVGTGEPGATITIRDPAGTAIGIATVTEAGTYSAPLTPAQTNGQTLSVSQIDAAGNPSPQVTTVAPDITAPGAPTAAVDATGNTVTGTGEPGATVNVRTPGGASLGSATVAADGSYTVPLSATQANGETVRVTQSDPAGNASPATTATAPDIKAPGAPTAAVTNGGSTVTGTGELGATVTVRGAGGSSLGTTVVAADGSYSVPLSSPQANGQTLQVTQADPAGNSSLPTQAVAPDTTAPAAPTGTVSADGTSVSGTGEPGATITIRDPGGSPIGTATVAANGGYTAPLSTPQANGQTLQVSQADPAGNASPSVPAIAPDVTAPAAPTGTVSGTGTSVTGTGEPGATVTVRDAGGTQIGTAVVAADGGYTAPLSTPQANGQTLQLSQSDPAGNISPTVSAVAPDITAPPAPTGSVSVDGTRVTGTGEPGAIVTVRNAGGNPIGTGVVAADGTYAAPLSTPQANGQALQVSQADPAGNVSPSANVSAPDSTPPAAPTATVNADGTAVAGLAEPRAMVRVTTPAGAVVTTTAGSDGSYTAPLAPAQVNGEQLVVSQADPAGNASPSVTTTAPDLTAPPPPTNVAVGVDGATVTGTGEPGATVEVRSAGGAVLGTGTVAANGSFSVTLPTPQLAGETLSVSQRDPAGNNSAAVPAVAPFDIDAFDNRDTASVDLAPVTTNVNAGTANYLALVSLGVLDLDAQVLATPSVQFTVAPGSSFDATFTYDAVLSLGVLSGYTVRIQQFDGTRWESIDGNSDASLLQLGLLNGNLVATETLGPGQYRAFVTFDGVAGAGVLGSLSVSGVNTDFTEVAAVTPAPTDGNVITDPGPDGRTDAVSTQTAVQSVTVNGVTTAVTADDTVVDGAHGTLVIDRNGAYTYTPDADARAIGETDVFTYTLRDADGELESATLSVTIGSGDLTAPPGVTSDTAVASATFENVVTPSNPTVDSSFNTPTAVVLTGARTGSVSDSFTVGPNSTADVTLSAIAAPGISVVPSYSITVTNSAGTVVGAASGTALAGLLGSGISVTMQDLPTGTYNYTVTSTNVLGLGYGTNVYVGQEVTHLDQFRLAGTSPTTGNLLDNDAVGTNFPVVRVQSGGSFVEVGDTSVTITGQYGTLTVNEVGDYTYRPSTGLAYAATDPVDQFTYQVVQPNGDAATARLDVTVDINQPGSVMASMAEAETVPLSTFSADAELASKDDPLPQLSLVTFEEEAHVDDLLGAYLATQESAGDAMWQVSANAAARLNTPTIAPEQQDPLGYLTLPEDSHDDRLMHAQLA